jgi:hypothetical protein
MKRLPLLLALSMTGGTTAYASVDEYGVHKPDVQGEAKAPDSISSWAKSDVEWMIANHLVPAALQNRFQAKITREEFSGIANSVVRRMTDGKSDYIQIRAESAFTDTSSQDVLQTFYLGIVNGVSDTEFKPTDYISRQEAAVMMHNMLNTFRTPDLITTEFPYPDTLSIADWASDAVHSVSNLGIFEGSDIGFRPLDNYTREQAIIVMKRLLDKKPSTTVLSVRGKIPVDLTRVRLGKSEKSQVDFGVGSSYIKAWKTEDCKTIGEYESVLSWSISDSGYKVEAGRDSKEANYVFLISW